MQRLPVSFLALSILVEFKRAGNTALYSFFPDIKPAHNVRQLSNALIYEISNSKDYHLNLWIIVQLGYTW